MMKKILKFIVPIFLMLIFNAGLSANGQRKQQEGQSLTSKQTAIVPIAAYAAKGEQAELKIALEKGLEAGLTVNEIKEILVHLYAYAGFPRSLNAINTFQNVLKERTQRGIIDLAGKTPGKQNFKSGKFTYGKNVQTQLTGSTAIGAAQTFVPIIDTMLKEHLFADIFARDNLDYKSREIVAISILATIGGADAQLRGHLNVGRNIGLTEMQMREIAEKLMVVDGPDAGSSATKILDNMFNTLTSNVDEALIAPIFSQGNKISGGYLENKICIPMAFYMI